MLVFIPSLGSFIAPDLLGGGKNLMIGNLIALQFQGSRNWPFGSAAAVILMTVVLCALMLYIRQQFPLAYRVEQDQGIGGDLKKVDRRLFWERGNIGSQFHNSGKAV